jgi:hypothetical protein
MFSIRLNNGPPGRINAARITPESLPALDQVRSIQNQIRLTQNPMKRVFVDFIPWREADRLIC